MKKEKGITLIILIIMVVLMAILITTTVNYGVNSSNSVKFQNFRYELEEVQGKVDAIYEKIKLGDESYITLGKEMTTSSEAMNTLQSVKNVDYSSIMTDTQKEKYYYQDTYTYYRFFPESELKEEFQISSNPGDMIINFKTREVISVDGFTYDGKTYYMLDQM